ncbi:flavodoxin family protein [Phytohabitans aurantiacus]|nr:flavodoxin domain-containing protein [Phytohabitans aurantiacus]
MRQAMKALVVYESMYGNTHAVADAIGEGLASRYQVEVVPVARAAGSSLDQADLLVVGGPTHASGMSRVGTREDAVAGAHQPGSTLVMDPDAGGPGLRDWLASLPPTLHARAAAFDTRIDMPVRLTGRASKGIAAELRKRHIELIAEPESFLVTPQIALAASETARAQQWGRTLAAAA